MAKVSELAAISKLVRYYILRMTTKAGSGHPTSSLSATELMVALFFNHLKFDIKDPENPANDRVIFSKGHASPLLYALYAAAGVLTEKELDTYRKFGSVLEGHPNPRFKYVEVATGSLGQGLSIGVGMALGMKIAGPVSHFLPASAHSSVKSRKSVKSVPLRAVGNPSMTATRNFNPRVYVLMGDSEVAEGSVWEAMEIASYYNLSNLVGIIDVNRLGQSRETMLDWDLDIYRDRVSSFGWDAQVVDGHNFDEIEEAFSSKGEVGKPKMIIAKTIKGRGVSFLENKEGWHGKALSQEDFEKALKELGEVNRMVRGDVAKPESKWNPKKSTTNYPLRSRSEASKLLTTNYKLGDMIPTRKAYGEALAKLGEIDSRIVALDGEVSNSTFSEIFAEKFPKRYFEMFIAEQNMAGVALGLSKRGFIPFASTFAAFLTRAFDQIRMSAYSRPNVKFVGSHTGVSIGEDGPSQMGLEDIAMFRAIFGSIVLCPADAVSCFQMVKIAAESDGLFYLRTARPPTPVLYSAKQNFKIGGSEIVRSSKDDKLTIVACGITVAEALKASEELGAKGINVRIIDAYSIKPIDEQTLRKSAAETRGVIITVEDHYLEGGLGDAVLAVFAKEGQVKIHKLAVSKLPMSGKADELLDYEGISAKSIEAKVIEVVG